MPDGKSPEFVTTETPDEGSKFQFSFRRTQDSDGGASTGWDPYEVWRTRVLLPRLKKNQHDIS